MRLLVTKDTVFKQQPVPAAQLAPDQRVNVPGGEFPLTAYEPAGKHILATLERPLRGINRWYIFQEHIAMLEEDAHPANLDAQPASPGDRPSTLAPTPAPTPVTAAPKAPQDLIKLPGDRSVSLSALHCAQR
jgi:hypothetical protein